MTGVTGTRSRATGLLRDVRVVVAGASAVLVTAVVVVVAHGGDPATADTYLQQVRSAVLVLANGTEVDAREGMRVPDGATLRTGSGGGAQLATGARTVYVGALSTIRVVDGVTQWLERGQVLVDGRGAAALALGTRAGGLRLPSGAQARVETGPVLRLGLYSGSARLTLPGRQATSDVVALHQVLVPYAGRPSPTTALALSDDAWEQRVVPELVAADRVLQGLSRGLVGGEASAVLTAAPVALRQVPGATADPGENALAVAVAQASRRSGPVADTLRDVERLRAEGGSWGVVAALVDTRVPAVSALLDAVLTPSQPVQAGPAPSLSALLGGATGSTRRPGGQSSGGTGGGTSGGPSPTPSLHVDPTPSSSPNVVQQLLTTVNDLLSPSPRALAPAPSSTPAATPPSSAPAPAVPLLR